jgi:hypothetical protein
MRVRARQAVLLPVFLLTLLIMPAAGAAKAKAKSSRTKDRGTLYIVLGVDTEPKPSDADNNQSSLNVTYLSDPSDSGPVAPIMKSDFRTRYRDSEGGNPRITWFLMSSEQICQQLACDTIYSQMAVFQDAMRRWGDEIGWHYHHVDLSTVDTGTTYRWNQLISFDTTLYTNGTDVKICENSLNHLIADAGFFPTVYRAGWCWENNDFSRWIENVIPYDLSCYSPKSFDWPEYLGSRSKEFDWSRAPLDWRPFHPDSSDYQRPGRMNRYLSRCVVGFTADDVNLFKHELDAGRDQLFAWATHSYGKPAWEFDIILGYLTQVCDSLGIRYRYAGATEACRQVLGIRAEPRPRINLVQHDSLLEVSVTGRIFQSSPYIVALGRDNSYERLPAEKTGNRSWLVTMRGPLPLRVYAAVSDLAGNARIGSIDITPLLSNPEEVTNKRPRRHH